jgi:hypothetical protein
VPVMATVANAIDSARQAFLQPADIAACLKLE